MRERYSSSVDIGEEEDVACTNFFIPLSVDLDVEVCKLPRESNCEVYTPQGAVVNDLFFFSLANSQGSVGFEDIEAQASGYEHIREMWVGLVAILRKRREGINRVEDYTHVILIFGCGMLQNFGAIGTFVAEGSIKCMAEEGDLALKRKASSKAYLTAEKDQVIF